MSSTLISFNLIDFFNIVNSFKIAIFLKFFNIVKVVEFIIANFRFIVFNLINFFDIVFVVLSIKITI